MVSDSISAVPIPSAANTKNPGKKKRTNRSAKLKQYKIDARREQWLSQGAVKSKGCKDGVEDDIVRAPPPAVNHGKLSLEPLNTRREGEEDDGLVHHDSDSESPTNCPAGVLCGNDSGTNFTGSSSGGSSSSSSSSSGGCCSGNITEEEEEEEEGEDDDDGCLDDWEAMADALAADDKHENPCSDSPPVVLPREGSNLGSPNSKPESSRLVPWGSGSNRAWRADDAFRPQSLPNLSKQHSMPNPDRRCVGGVPWGRISTPSPCPICCEDLDLTDTNFLPCFCGFRLCLFCHKRILEEDGRCPGCRKPYECEPVETEASVHGGSLTLRLARSCSMIERS
ncbi:hypothetical protein PHAVU_003G196200 [Phaseolus vulgaris]|uniref:RING-type domain-containing protein n=1 Tax=Phaseolus vulgaris TaxID=3885 RepID=V7CB10_PHAVU|nr:hypothetical protein PHAVU_003G196200g [Phaseolus vulgaris]ESW27372.1 hypothetical protein PHAVU_003G196200g [Phaseolus vulgaris]